MDRSHRNLLGLGSSGLAFAVLLSLVAGHAGAENMSQVPAYADSSPDGANRPTEAVLAGGCFWGLETVFQHVDGVKQVVTGYAGGPRQTANYATVSSGQTQQAESVRIVYDPEVIGYSTLLRIYFSAAHDPTQVDRQGPDTGHEYRSAIFALNTAQKHIAGHYIDQLDADDVFHESIATEINPIKPAQFYAAAEQHQNYALKHPNSMYIQVNDKPKVAALKREFPAIHQQKSSAAADDS